MYSGLYDRLQKCGFNLHNYSKTENNYSPKCFGCNFVCKIYKKRQIVLRRGTGENLGLIQFNPKTCEERGI